MTRKLELANEELKRKDQLKNEFINVAAHELRTPIQPILCLTELLRRRSMVWKIALALITAILMSAALGSTNIHTTSQIYHNTNPRGMVWKIALALITAILMSAALGYSYHVANAQSFSKKSSTNCEGDVCHTTVCIDNSCHTSLSNPAELVRQLKSHGIPSNVVQQFLNSPNP